MKVECPVGIKEIGTGEWDTMNGWRKGVCVCLGLLLSRVIEGGILGDF